jgi:hypothetical protein
VSDRISEHPTEPKSRAEKKKSSKNSSSSNSNNQYKLAKKNSVPKPEQAFYDYVGRSFTDTDDMMHFQIARIVTPIKPSATKNRQVLFYQYFDTSKFTAAPIDENDYEHTPCSEMIRYNRKLKQFITPAKYMSWDSTNSVHSTATKERISLGTRYIQEGLSLSDFEPDSMSLHSTFHSSPTDQRLNVTADGKKLTMKAALRSPEKHLWKIEQGIEISRLMGTKTITPILQRDMPKGRKATYYNPQPKEKLDADKNIIRRVRGTLGGDRLDYPGETSSPVADIAAVKMLLHSVVSDRRNHGTDTRFATLDLTDFYLGSSLDRPEYVRIPIKDVPEETIEREGLRRFINGDFILFQVDGSMYGHPVSGRIANRDLVAHLKEHSYNQDPNVPCLFEHATNKTVFTLIVDDFGVKYTGIENFNELVRILNMRWPVKTDITGKKFLGMRIDWHYDAVLPHFYPDMPTTIPDALARFYPNGTCKGASTPSTYVPPFKRGPPDLGATVDNSKPVSLEVKKFIQQVVGVFLFYARTIDITMLPATRAISEHQSSPTEKTLADAHQL